MKNNTKIRLHLSKSLFESLTREIIKEAKANDGYTVAVKQPKQPKVNELFGLGAPKAKYKVGQQVKVKGAKGQTEGEETLVYITKVLSTDKDKGSIYQAAREKGALNPKYEFHDDKVISEMEKMEEVDAVKDTEGMRKMHEMSSKEKMAKGLYKEDEMEEMQINVAEKNKMNEFTGTETESSGAIAMLAAALGMGIPLAAALIKDLMRAKTPEEKKQVIQKELPSKDGGDVAPKEAFGPQNESKKKVMPKLNELRKQIKNK